MPIKKILSEFDKNTLIQLPELEDEFIRIYSLSEQDISIIESNCRGKSNKLGFAVLLSYMRCPGIILPVDEYPTDKIIQFLSLQLNIPSEEWLKYGKRAQTRREHLSLIQSIYGYRMFNNQDYNYYFNYLMNISLQTDKGILIVQEFIKDIKKYKILQPSINTIENLCSEALMNAEKQIFDKLSFSLSITQKDILDNLLNSKEKSNVSYLNWLKQSPKSVNSKSLLIHIERLKFIKEINLHKDIGKDIHQNRLLKIAREGRHVISPLLRTLKSRVFI